jgi:hypothetical protein
MAAEADHYRYVDKDNQHHWQAMSELETSGL